jgi:hypothetical protein
MLITRSGIKHKRNEIKNNKITRNDNVIKFLCILFFANNSHHGQSNLIDMNDAP